MRVLYIFRIFLFIFCFTSFGFIGKVLAQEMKSQNFKIQQGNFNITSGNKASTNFKLSDVVGQTAAVLFSSKGYLIQSGYLNGAMGEVFSFSVIPVAVDFGDLSPNTPVEKTIKLTISNGNVPGYTVKVSANQPLSTSVGAEIVDTVCDGPAVCSAAAAAAWVKNTSYGFGYRIVGKTVPADFAKEGFFRPFPAIRRNEQPMTVMQTQAKKVTDQATVTLKVNVGPNQPVGQYRNTVSFTAMAGI
ncbi:hypothetical protein FJY90_05565 [Candidatus Gottesmanbacteria bacterium]|nr:hypothetical protein [Candidatus Gottesmanbacteria bacterium]